MRENPVDGDGPESPASGAGWVTTIPGHALADPARLLSIGEIAVLGSYLDPVAGYPGDLDLAVSVVRRDSDRDLYVRKVLAYARASGRRFDAFHELLYWPARELRMILKNRSPAISITDEDISQFTDCFEIIYASRNLRTARTRRCPVSVSGRSSLVRMLRTCFSTVPSVT